MKNPLYSILLAIYLNKLHFYFVFLYIVPLHFVFVLFLALEIFPLYSRSTWECHSFMNYKGNDRKKWERVSKYLSFNIRDRNKTKCQSFAKEVSRKIPLLCLSVLHTAMRRDMRIMRRIRMYSLIGLLSVPCQSRVRMWGRVWLIVPYRGIIDMLRIYSWWLWLVIGQGESHSCWMLLTRRWWRGHWW